MYVNKAIYKLEGTFSSQVSLIWWYLFCFYIFLDHHLLLSLSLLLNSINQLDLHYIFYLSI